MPSQANKEKVKQIKKWFEKADSFLVLNYKGLRVSEANELRTILGGYDVDFRVLKNTLTRIALTQVSREDVVPLIDGPVAVAFVRDDVPAVAKVIKEFSRGRGEIFFKGGCLEGRLLTAGDVDALAILPPREVLLARVVGQAAAPLSGLVNVCAGPIRKMLGLMAALRDGRQESGATAEPEAQRGAAPEREAEAVSAGAEPVGGPPPEEAGTATAQDGAAPEREAEARSDEAGPEAVSPGGPESTDRDEPPPGAGNGAEPEEDTA